MVPATVGGWVAAGVFCWLWIGAKEDLAAEIERCNTDKVSAIAMAEDIARQAEREAAGRRLADLEQRIDDAEKARLVAVRAAAEAQSRPMRVQEVVRRVADENLCIDLPVPGAVLDELRN